jgi:hypothetical protein
MLPLLQCRSCTIPLVTFQHVMIQKRIPDGKPEYGTQNTEHGTPPMAPQQPMPTAINGTASCIALELVLRVLPLQCFNVSRHISPSGTGGEEGGRLKNSESNSE